MISIIVPVYNAERYIRECIESVFGQTYSDWELIIVNDGSTDNSESIITEFLSDKRISYLRKENSGVTETRWVGIENAKGDTVMFLDADDVLLQGALQIVADNIRKGIDVVAFEMQSFNKPSELNQNIGRVPTGKFITGETELARQILLGNFLSCVWGGAYRRELFNDCKNLFCNGLRIAEDTMFNLELAINKPLNVLYLPVKIYGYRINESSITRQVSLKRFDAVKDALDYLEAFNQRNRELNKKIRDAIGFRVCLLWSTYLFHPGNVYYTDKLLRKKIRKMYIASFPHLYPYLKVYLFIDLFISKWLSRKLINRKSR